MRSKGEGQIRTIADLIACLVEGAPKLRAIFNLLQQHKVLNLVGEKIGIASKDADRRELSSQSMALGILEVLSIIIICPSDRHSNRPSNRPSDCLFNNCDETAVGLVYIIDPKMNRLI